MIDLSDIPLIDNHCHPILREQHLDALRFRSLFTESSDPAFAALHVPRKSWIQNWRLYLDV